MLIIVNLVGLGAIKSINDHKSLLISAFVFQCCGGFGKGLCSTSSLAHISSDRQKRQEYIAYFEILGGLGAFVGPMLGGIFYTVGGFRAPFFGIALIFLPVLLFTFTRNTSGQSFSYVSDSAFESEQRVLSLKDILGIRRSLFGLIIQFLAFFMTCYNSPILNIRLDKEGFRPQFISLVVSVSSISYAIGIPTVAYLTNCLNKRSILFLGLLFGEVGWLITGIPST